MWVIIGPKDVDVVLEQLDKCDPMWQRYIYTGGLANDGVVLEVPFDSDAIYLKFQFPRIDLLASSPP